MFTLQPRYKQQIQTSRLLLNAASCTPSTLSSVGIFHAKSTSQGRNLSPQCLQNPHLNHNKSIKSTQTCMWWSWKVIFIVFDIFCLGDKDEAAGVKPSTSLFYQKNTSLLSTCAAFYFSSQDLQKSESPLFLQLQLSIVKHKMSWDLVASKLRDGLVFSPHAGITFRDRSQTTQDDKMDENDMIMRRKKKAS